MRSLIEVERELAFIETAISLLERSQLDYSQATPVTDPGYWRVRLTAVTKTSPPEHYVETKAAQLRARLQRLSSRSR